MYAVVRNYTGADATKLFDLLEERKSEVETVIRSITGFVSYSLVRTHDGGFTMTVCEDQKGTDKSLTVAREWIKENAPNLNVEPPSVSQGAVVLHLS